LDEKHLWFSTQTFAVYVVEIPDNVENADWLGVTRVENPEFAVGQETADKRIIVGVVDAR